MTWLKYSLFFALGLLSTLDARVWRDTYGHSVEAEFVRMSGESVHLRRKDGSIVKVNFGILSPQDRQYLATRAGGSKSFKVMEAVKRVDAAVQSGLTEKGLKYNESLNDFMFVRRVYTDLAGRIPTYNELIQFLASSDQAKRKNLVDKLIGTEDYVSHNFNYFADLLRIQTKVPGTVLRTDAFIHWFKEQLRKNRPFDDLVEEMVTAEGRIWENPAVGYHLRDNGMKLDHVSFMTKVFLGADISCAQCHDDPFQDWTQYEYYELSAFLGDMETKRSINPPRGKKGPRYVLNRDKVSAYIANKNGLDPKKEQDKQRIRRETQRLNRAFNEVRAANELVVHSRKNQPLRLPDDYQYDDFKPKTVVKPRAIFGQELGAEKSSVHPRKRLGTWLVSQKNPRFAASIANRIWARFFGRGVAEPLHNFLEEDAYNPKLLKVLSDTMVELDFDLQAFTRVIISTKAYNTLATRGSVSAAEPYYFSGPVLRRMSAEQIWDSLLTLMVKDPMAFRSGKGEEYNRIVNLLSTGPQEVEPLLARLRKYRSFKPLTNLKDKSGTSYMAASTRPVRKGTTKPSTKQPSNAKLSAANKLSVSQEPKMMQDMSMMLQTARRSNVTLARASELQQPMPPGHFLSKFGQSERNFVVGAASVEGSVPQVMELMNGAATMVLTKPDSLLFQKMKNAKTPMDRAQIVFLSILNRRILPEEHKMLVEELKRGPQAMPNLIWALLNTPEFIFIK